MHRVLDSHYIRSPTTLQTCQEKHRPEFFKKHKKKQGVKAALSLYFKNPVQVFMLCFQWCFQ